LSLNFSDKSNVIDSNNNEKIIEAQTPTLTGNSTSDNTDGEDQLKIGESVDNDMDIISLD